MVEIAIKASLGTATKNPEESERLVAAFLAGQPEAKGQIFDRYAPYIERLLVRVMGSSDEVEDLLHEVFMRAFSHLHRLKEPRSLESWLTRIAVNKARSSLRKKARSRWLVFLPEDELPQVPTATSDISQKLVACIYATLHKIRNPEDRLAFALRHLEEMTLPEVADACSCSLATVKRRVRRGRDTFVRLAREEPLLAERLEDM